MPDFAGDTLHVGLICLDQRLPGKHSRVVPVPNLDVTLEADFAGQSRNPWAIDWKGSGWERIRGEDTSHLGGGREDVPVGCPSSRQTTQCHF